MKESEQRRGKESTLSKKERRFNCNDRKGTRFLDCMKRAEAIARKNLRQETERKREERFQLQLHQQQMNMMMFLFPASGN
jgi:hypothetical protein